MQATWYALAKGASHFYIHYVASDDLRLTTFDIPTSVFEAQVNLHIDTIQQALQTRTLPAYQGFLGWHGMADYANYPEFVGLSGPQAEALLKELYPESYKKLKEGKIT
jgi:hypothetical protein